jgi:hypothetical protein
MKYAYEAAFGNVEHYGELIKVLNYNPFAEQGKQADIDFSMIQNKELAAILKALFTRQPSNLSIFHVNYSEKLKSGWFGVGRRHDVPKKACYVGHCGNTYV